MKVVFLAPGWPPSRFPNGIVTAVSTLAPALRQLGHEARILAVGGDSDGDSDVATLHEAAPPPRAPDPVRLLRNRLAPHRILYKEVPDRIARGLERDPRLRGADIFEIEESFGWSARVAARTAIPVVTRLRGPWIMNGAALKGAENFDDDDLRRISNEGAAIAAATALTAPSRYVLDLTRDHYGLELEHGVVIPNPVKLPDEEAVWRPETADRNRILFVGRFDRHKGADIILRAFARLAATRPKLRLEFIGPNSEPLNKGGSAWSLADFLRSAMPPDIIERVDVKGPRPREYVAQRRRRAFVTVVPSRNENFGNVVLEAMSAGSPIVATKVGGTPEAGRDGEELILTEAEPSALEENISALLDNVELAASLGAAARKRALADYAPENIAARTAEFYSETIVSRRQRRGRALS